MTIIKKVSIPFAAVMLGLAALGNLLQSYSEGLRAFCGLLVTISLKDLPLSKRYCKGF